MNWIQGIQSAIDYVEANLTGEIDYEEAANATPDITAMWQELGKDGAMARLIACMPEKPVMKGLLGICFSAELDAKRFPYGIGVEYDGRDVDDDLEVVTIPAHTYAVFTSRGKMPDAFIETYNRIVTEFFPQSTQYEYAESVEFEVYSSENLTISARYGSR